jgi:hypothetical protein
LEVMQLFFYAALVWWSWLFFNAIIGGGVSTKIVIRLYELVNCRYARDEAQKRKRARRCLPRHFPDNQTCSVSPSFCNFGFPSEQRRQTEASSIFNQNIFSSKSVVERDSYFWGCWSGTMFFCTFGFPSERTTSPNRSICLQRHFPDTQTCSISLFVVVIFRISIGTERRQTDASSICNQNIFASD